MTTVVSAREAESRPEAALPREVESRAGTGTEVRAPAGGLDTPLAQAAPAASSHANGTVDPRVRMGARDDWMTSITDGARSATAQRWGTASSPEEETDRPTNESPAPCRPPPSRQGKKGNGDGSGIDWKTSDGGDEWRWIEQWIPHSGWFLVAASAMAQAPVVQGSGKRGL